MVPATIGVQQLEAPSSTGDFELVRNTTFAEPCFRLTEANAKRTSRVHQLMSCVHSTGSLLFE